MRFFAVFGLLLCLAWGGAVHAQEQNTELDKQCAPQLLGSWGAKEIEPGQRPAQGWEPLTIPHISSESWPQWLGAVWYRLDWKLNCPQSMGRQEEALALAISGMRQAGEVYWNDALLWRDRSLAEPMSRSWNMPRWWPVSIQSLDEVQTAWIRVVAWKTEFKGLGYVQLADVASIQQAHSTRYWRQRLSYVITGSLSLTIACVALVVWMWRRSEKIYGWMGIMQVFWTLYLSVVLSLEPWPGLSNHGMVLLNLIFFMLYAHCFLAFILRFCGQKWPRLEMLGWGALAIWVACLTMDESVAKYRGQLSLLWGVVVFNGGCLYAMYRALRTREPQQLWLAAGCAVMLVVAVHDIEVAFRYWDNDQTWSFISWPLNMLGLAVLLGWQVAKHMRSIDSFNAQLQQSVTEARAELAQALQREHAHALQHAKLQERVQIAHDLHDGLGGSLVRSMALVEQAPQQLSNERVLSLLKTLRDDLRQVIDSGSSSGTSVPQTPKSWMAPLRHRFMHVLDELDIKAQWQVDDAWIVPPSTLQCLGMLRFLEEAFTNIIKHSRASHVRVTCTQLEQGVQLLCVEDDGIGFDMHAVQQAGMSVGMRSMQARIERIGGSVEVTSEPGKTVLTARIRLHSST